MNGFVHLKDNNQFIIGPCKISEGSDIQLFCSRTQVFQYGSCLLLRYTGTCHGNMVLAYQVFHYRVLIFHVYGIQQ